MDLTEKMKVPAGFAFPFKKDGVDSIWISCRKKWSGQGFGKWKAHITFQQASTSGKQEFEADTLEGVIMKMKIFLDDID